MKIAYSAIALSKRKAIKRDIREKFGRETADRISDHITKTIAKLKKYPQMGISMRKQYNLDCDYYILFAEHNYFIYRISDDTVIILEVFHEKEEFMYQMFGIEMSDQNTIDYWGES